MAPSAEHIGASTPIWNVRTQRFVSEVQLVDALATARYRLLGEVHDNPAHHAIRARLVKEIAATGARPAIVFEQFDLEHDNALVAARAAGGGIEDLVVAGKLDRNAWGWPLHKPIFDAALALHLPIRAGNVSRSALGGDPQGDRNAMWYPRLHAVRFTEEQATALRTEIIESHCNELPEALVPRLVAAQRVRDAAMAQALVNDATNDGAILVAGNGHVRTDRGVPLYLHAPGLPEASARSISVGLVEVTPDDQRSGRVPPAIATEHREFDYVWLTPSAPRDDPCATTSMPTAAS
jgi:uncharacterized iron-regulated protein